MIFHRRVILTDGSKPWLIDYRWFPPDSDHVLPFHDIPMISPHVFRLTLIIYQPCARKSTSFLPSYAFGSVAVSGLLLSGFHVADRNLARASPAMDRMGFILAPNTHIKTNIYIYITHTYTHICIYIYIHIKILHIYIQLLYNSM